VQTCSKCHTQSPDSTTQCSHCGVDLKDWSDTAVALKQLQDNPRVIYVRVSVSENSCPACRKAEGAYAKESAPKLPVEGCSHGLGCRCFYQPVLDMIYP
jgi:hypothetical protein